MRVTETKIYEFDEFRLESAERRLFRHNDEVKISSKAFDVLVVLVENAGHLVSKDEIYERVWPDAIVEDANLTVQISALRKAIGSGTIETIKGHGYRFSYDVLVHDETVEEVSIEKRTIQRLTIEHDLIDDVEQPDHAAIAVAEPELAVNPSTGSQRIYQNRFFAFTLIVMVLVVTLGLGSVLWRGGNGSASSLKASEIRRLTTSGNVTVAALSPDGRLYVHAVAEEEGESLWLGHVSGGNPVKLRPAAAQRYLAISFSKGGDHFYYVVQDIASRARTFRRSPVLGPLSETVIENVDAPFAISPDENYVAFVRDSEIGNTSKVIIVDLLGRSEVALATRPWNNRFSKGGISWSPDGKVLAVAAITDKKGIVSEILGIRVADGSSYLLSPEKWNDVFKLEWQQDGKGIFLIGSDLNGWYWGQIWHLSYPEGESRRITLDFNSYLPSSLSVSADGSTVLGVQHQQLNGIWVAPADEPSSAVQISDYKPGVFEGLFGLSWTSEGQIIFGAYVGKDQTIWKMDADGSNNRQIVSGGFIDSLPVASHNGRHLVFHSNRSDTFEIWRTDLDGGNLRPITADTQNYQPTISPDGQWVIYRSWKDEAGRLWKASTDGGSPIQFTEYPASWPQFSPDGSRVAYAAANRRIEIADSLTGIKLFEFRMPDGSIAWNGMRWMPDGNAITIRDSKRGIWRIDLSDPTAPHKIEGLLDEKIYNFSWSPDGKKLALTKGTERDDVVLIKLSF